MFHLQEASQPATPRHRPPSGLISLTIPSFSAHTTLELSVLGRKLRKWATAWNVASTSFHDERRWRRWWPFVLVLHKELRNGIVYVATGGNIDALYTFRSYLFVVWEGREQTLSHFIRCSLSTILSPQLRATTTYNIISCAVVQLSLMRCWWMLSFEYHRKVFMGRFLWQSLGCITFRDRILSVGSESSEDERQGLWLFADDEIVIKY